MIITETDQPKKNQKSYDYKPEINTDVRFSNIKIALVLPAFNEEKNIGYVLSKISPFYSENMDIIVVDDGSSDKTVKVAKNYDTLILYHQENKGNGAATITGLNFCKNKGYDLAIILDADGQHDPNFIPLFINTILNDKADFVIGNRFNYFYDMNPIKKICSKLLTVFYFFLYGKKISDPSNGYRALSKKILQENSFQSHYSITQEMLFKVLPKYKCKEIPIQLKSRREGKSFIKIKKYFGIMISSFLKFYILEKLNKIYNILF
ncbi:MAG: glycosyltransferase family 2 protein [Promethearchaeati archaeon]